MRRITLLAGFACFSFLSLAAETPRVAGPVYNAKGELIRPTDYREWIFLTSGMGMTYGPNGPAEGQDPAFDNVFVNPAAYHEFVKSGAWPNGTIFILEIRKGVANESINRGGRTQTSVQAIEAAVKDETQFPEKWAYFHFASKNGEPAKEVKAFPKSAACFACHTEHGAVENTFVQFYPTLLEIAKAKKTLKAAHEPASK